MKGLLGQDRGAASSSTGGAYTKRNVRYGDEEMVAEPMAAASEQPYIEYTDERLPQIGTPRSVGSASASAVHNQRYLDARHQQLQPPPPPNQSQQQAAYTTTQQPMPKRQQFYLNQQQQLRQMFVDNQTPVYVPPFLVDQDARPLRSHHHNAPFDYLPWSIANIFLCVIIAMPALFFSIQTRDLKRAGDVKQARLNSKRSLILNIVASVVGVLTIMLALILRFALYQLFVYQDVQSQNVPLIAGG